MTYHFVNHYIMKDENGKVIQDREWNPDEKSQDGWRCPGCDELFPSHYDDEDCVCVDKEGPFPPRNPVQIVRCFNCDEYILADVFIDHVGECLS